MGFGLGIFFCILFAWEEKIGWDRAVNSFSIPHQVLCFWGINKTCSVWVAHTCGEKGGFNTPKSICLGINQKQFESLKIASCLWGLRHPVMSF